MTDYCTGWPDGVPQWMGGKGNEWAVCCLDHDAFYRDNDMSLNWPAFIDAHTTLAGCVGGIMGAVMWTGLMTFGFVVWVHYKNKYIPGKYKSKDR